MIILIALCLIWCILLHEVFSSPEHFDDQIRIIRKHLVSRQSDVNREYHGKFLDLEDIANLPGLDEANDASLWSFLGMLLQVRDARYPSGAAGAIQEEALTAFKKALELASKQYDAGKLNGDDDIEEERIDWDENYKRFLFTVHSYKGMLLKMMGRGDESIISHQLAFNSSENVWDKASARHHEASALSMMGRVSEAAEKYQEALKWFPAHLESYLPLVECYKELNTFQTKEQWKAFLEDMEEALESWLDEKELDAKSLGDISRYRWSRQHASTSIGASASELEHAGGGIHWALYAAADKAGLYSVAWTYLEEAHRHEIMKRGGLQYDPSMTIQQAEQIRSIFQPHFWPEGIGMDSKKVVFIVGMMRSGSTLVETMLDAHNDVWGMGEDSVFNANLPLLRDEIVGAITSDRGVDHLQTIIEKHGKYVIKKMTEMAMKDIARTPNLIDDQKDGNSTQLTEKEKKKMKTMGKKKKLSKDRKKILRVVDKMLFNFRNIGFIHLVYPNAVILHTMRDPMDTVFSCYNHKFDDRGLDWALSIEGIALQYSLYLETMDHFRRVLPGRVIDVRYEELVKNPLQVMQQVIKKLDLPWDDNVLSFHKSNRTVQTHSMSQVRQSIYTNSIGSWRRYAKQLKPLIQAMKKRLAPLKAKKALPFPELMNWDLRVDFDYGDNIARDDDDDGYDDEKDSTNENIDKIIDENDENDGNIVDDDIDNDEDDKEKVEIDEKKDQDGKLTISGSGVEDTKIRENRSLSGWCRCQKQQSSNETDSRNDVQEGEDEDEHTKLMGWLLNRLEKRITERRRQGKGRMISGGKKKPQYERGKQSDSQKVQKQRQQRQRQRRQQRRSKSTFDDEEGKRQTKKIDEKLAAKLAVMYMRYVQQMSFPRSILDAFIRKLSFRSKYKEVNALVAAGFMLVNNQNFLQAKSLFYELLQCFGQGQKDTQNFDSTESSSKRLPFKLDKSDEKVMVHIYTGLGSAQALSGETNEALNTFNLLLELDPMSMEGLTRRAEVLNFLGKSDEALRDLNFAIASDGLTMHPELLLSRGNIHFQRKYHLLAFEDFKAVFRNISPPPGFRIDGIDDMISDAEMNQVLMNYDRSLLSRLYIHLGKSFSQFGDMDKALSAYATAMELDPANTEPHMLSAIASMEAGKWEQSIAFLDRTFEGHDLIRSHGMQSNAASLKNAYGYRALLMQNLGRHREALQYLTRALEIDPTDMQCLLISAVCLQGQGLFDESVAMYNRILRIDSNHHSWHRREVAYFYAGKLYTPFSLYNIDNDMDKHVKDGVANQSRLPNGEKGVETGKEEEGEEEEEEEAEAEKFIKKSPHEKDFMRYKNGVKTSSTTSTSTITTASNSKQRDVAQVCIDDSCHPEIERNHENVRNNEGISKEDRLEAMPFDANSINSNANANVDIDFDAIDKLSKAIAPLASFVQLDSPGFLPNSRLQKTFCLSAVEMAQTLLQHVSLVSMSQSGNIDAEIHEKSEKVSIASSDSSVTNSVTSSITEDDQGLLIPDSKCSKVGYFGFKASARQTGYHIFGWRDFSDIAVRWRQVSEPMDAVFWIDKLPLKTEFSERVGLNTYMTKGTNKVVRYYPYFEATFIVTKQHLLSKGYYDNNENLIPVAGVAARAAVESSTSPEQLYKAVGKRPLFVVLPCASTILPGRNLNGTRVTLAKNPIEGYDFSICSAATPERFVEYEEELNGIFHRLVNNLVQCKHAIKSSGGSFDDVCDKSLHLHLSFSLFYYWVNFAALTRGTSATGYAMLSACILLAGEQLTSPLPRFKQLDWEALVSPDAESFVSKALTTLLPTRSKLSSTIASLGCLSDDTASYPTSDSSNQLVEETEPNRNSIKIKPDSSSCKTVQSLFPNLHSVLEFLKEKPILQT